MLEQVAVPVGDPAGTATWQRGSPLALLARALRLRCPRCAQRKVVQRWFTTPTPCPRCGLDFNPDGDAAVGWIIVNLGITEIAFITCAFLALVATWPTVPWTGLTVSAVAGNLILPLVLVPFSRTIWAAIFLLLHRMDGRLAEDV